MQARRLSGPVDEVRGFNRFYTRQIGLLQEGILRSDFSLTEARVLYELAHHPGTVAARLVRELGVDRGQLSRILRRFAQRGLIHRTRSPGDARQQSITLTRAGEAAFAGLDAASAQDTLAMLSGLEPFEQRRLAEAMHCIKGLLEGDVPGQPFTLRRHRAGDMGWVVERHGALYRREYGWDERFEALVAEIVAVFLNERDDQTERCWIAERGGARIGCVFLVRHPERPGVARLRLLLVEPDARGLGVGRTLVHACTEFARAAGYHTLTLWTQSNLLAARHLYAQEGYRLIHQAPHHSFGHNLVEEVWELDLRRR